MWCVFIVSVDWNDAIVVGGMVRSCGRAPASGQSRR